MSVRVKRARTPEEQAAVDAEVAVMRDVAVKVTANRAALDALAAEARTFAKGDGALTAAALTIVLRKQAEMLARMHFDIRYGDE